MTERTARGKATVYGQGRASVPGSADAPTGRVQGDTRQDSRPRPRRRIPNPLKGLTAKLPRKFRMPSRKTRSSVALVVTGAVFVAAVLTASGFPAAEVSLHDGGVWVTNRNDGEFGRFNRPIEQLDARLSAGGNLPDIDVLQDGNTVFLVDRDASLLQPVSVSNIELGEGPKLPGDSQVALGGNVIAVLDKATGKVWVRPADQLDKLDIEKDEPTAVAGAEAAVTVGQDGTAYVISSAVNKMVTIAAGGKPVERDLGVDIVEGQVAAVGSEAVVLGKDGKLVLPDETVTVSGAGPRLQQTGPAADQVLVSTDKELFGVDVSNGDVEKLAADGSGLSAAPVRLGACVHSAWSGQPATYVRKCDGVQADKPVQLNGLGSNADLIFRVNRDVVVLNDAAGGAVYLFERGGEDLGNWEKAREQIKATPDETDKSPVRDPNKNTPPKAEDDKLGARPGQAALLHVLDNDNDPDGDVLIIQSHSAVKPAGAGKLTIVENGQALQFVAAPGANGSANFRYTIDDGRGGKATANVTMKVSAEGNKLPFQRPTPIDLVIEQGGSLTYNVLRDWRDEDGDALLLEGATTDSPDKVRFNPAGDVTFSAADNSSPTVKFVELKVTDGRGSKAGKIKIKVIAHKQDGKPQAKDDIVTAIAGQVTTIRPLDNDFDPNTTVPGSEQRLRLTSISPAPTGTTATPDFITNKIAFTANKPGTYYLRYKITDGKSQAEGKIRIDARKGTSAYAPVAVADQVALRGSAPSVVDVLANDVDLDGDVLVVRSVEVPENAGLSVSVVEHRWLRVTAAQSGVGSNRHTVRYVVSDGSRSDTGVVAVTLMPPATENQPPLTLPDSATVRAGDVVTIDVLANDSDPDGSSLVLDQRPPVDDDAENKRGVWMVAGNVVRFHASDKAGTVTASYTVRDAQGRSAIGQVSVTVIAANAPNQIPQPPPIQARAFAGATVRIQIPLTGVDPDGDSVLLLGPTSAPKLGRIVKQGIDFMDYEAYATAGGTDVFTYRVQDTQGGLGTGSVRIGVVPFPERNSAPVAVDDILTVSPGTTVRAPALANDSDVDNDPLRLEPLDKLNPNLPAGTVIDRDRIVIKAGAKNGDIISVRYGVSDGRGQRATASVTIIARDGANIPPIARDDMADPVSGGATSVDVDVLANDDDLDGPRSELQLKPIDVGGGPKSTVTSDGKLRIPLTKVPRQVAYSLQDAKGGNATAFVRVPGTGNQPPHLRPDAPVLTIPSGAELPVDIAKLVVDPEGATVRLTNTASISTSPSNGLSLVSGASTESSFKLKAANDYHGLAAVVFEITDGTVSTSVSVPVTVTPAAGQAPVFSCPPVEPAAGAPAVTVDLPRCVQSGASEGVTFKNLGEVPGGITATLNGHQLEVSAAPDAQIGDRGKLKFTVVDAKGVSAPAELGVVVQPSGLAVAVTDEVTGAKANQEQRISVLANDQNPFPTPLKLVSVEVVSGPAVDPKVDTAAGTVIVTPNQAGKADLRYMVQDATGKIDRQVMGQIVIHVIDRPLQITSPPVARSTGSGFAVLAWSEPDSQGSPISEYEVKDQSGDTYRCATFVCKLSGLDNGKKYRFSVRAKNEAGYSDPSPQSAEVQPDAKPEPPAPPTTKFGDSQITVNWAKPDTNGGSNIEMYEVEISPPSGPARTSTGTSLVWNGLSNGTAYTFRVRAKNVTYWSEWSSSSAPEVPAKAPDAPAAPTAAGVSDGIGKQIVVNWNEPATNGAAISEYRLTVYRNGSQDQNITTSGDTRTATVNVDNGVNYTFRVVAVNKAGASAQSPPSANTVAHGKPFTITTHSYSDNSGGTGYDRRIAYTLTAPNDNGMAISRYEFDVNGDGSPDENDTGTSGFVTGLANGTTYRPRVRACNDMCGDWSGNGNAVIPYGPPVTPNAGASKNGAQSVTLSWSSNGTNGRPIANIQTNVNGGGWTNRGAGNGSQNYGNGYNQTYTIQVRVVDTAGQISSVDSASATTDPPPSNPAIDVYKGTSAQGQPNCSSVYCAYVKFTVTDFPDGSFNCTINSAHGALGSTTVNVSGGTGTKQAASYYGYNTGWVTVTCNGVTGREDPWN